MPQPKRSVRILQLVPEVMPTFRADVAALFGKYLPRHGISCDVVGKGSVAPLTDQGFASVRRAPTGARWRKELGYALLAIRALLGARRSNCDLIQARDMVTLGVMAMLIARAKGIPFVYWMSFLMNEGRMATARARLRTRPTLRDRIILLKGLTEQFLLHKVLLRASVHVFVQSDAMLATLAKQGVPREKMTAVPMGVDMEAMAARPEPRRLPGWEDVPLLAYLGTMDAMRDLTVVVDALALVRRSFPTARLLLIGDASKRADVEKLLVRAAEHGFADALHVTGWLPSAQAWQLLAGADAAISYFPRGDILDTNSPTKILEYLALGLPSVGNDNPDQRGVILGSQAAWLTASSAEGLAEAACEIFADPQAATTRAAAGPRYIEMQRSYRVLSEMVAERYKTLLAGQ